MTDPSPTVTQQSDLNEYLVALTYFLGYCASISLIKHANKVVGESIRADVAVVYALFHRCYPFSLDTVVSESLNSHMLAACRYYYTNRQAMYAAYHQ
jgi:hypothetical protein